MLCVNLKRYVIFGAILFAVSSILCATDCYAVFGNLTNTGWEIFSGMKKIIFAAAGFGIVAIAIGSFFGALNWKWLSAVIIGLVVIAGTAGLVSYLTAGTGANVTVDQNIDSLINAMD